MQSLELSVRGKLVWCASWRFSLANVKLKGAAFFRSPALATGLADQNSGMCETLQFTLSQAVRQGGFLLQ